MPHQPVAPGAVSSRISSARERQAQSNSQQATQPQATQPAPNAPAQNATPQQPTNGLPTNHRGDPVNTRNAKSFVGSGQRNPVTTVPTAQQPAIQPAAAQPAVQPIPPPDTPAVPGNAQPAQAAVAQAAAPTLEAGAPQVNPQGQSTTQPAQQAATQQPASPSAQPAKPDLKKAAPRRVTTLDNPKALIALPGEPVRTVEQIMFEVTKGRNADRLLGLARQEASAPQPQQQPVQQMQSAQPARTEYDPDNDPYPELPAGAMEGDPEWVKWQGAVIGWNTRAANAPMYRMLKEQQVRESSKTSGEQEAQRIFQENDQVFTAQLVENLPFDLDSIEDADARQEIFDKVRQVGLQLRGIDIADPNAQRSARWHPDTIAHIVTRAWPEGTAPKGYALEGAPEDPPDETTLLLNQLGSQPLVPPAPPEAPLMAGAPTSAATQVSQRPSFTIPGTGKGPGSVAERFKRGVETQRTHGLQALSRGR